MDETNSINIEQIMDEIREDIRRKGIVSDLPDFKKGKRPAEDAAEAFDAEEFALKLGAFEDEYQVNAFPEIGGGRSFIKKVIRRLISFQTAPPISEQNIVNMDTAELFQMVGAYMKDRDRRIEELTKEVEELKKRLPGEE